MRLSWQTLPLYYDGDLFYFNLFFSISDLLLLVFIFCMLYEFIVKVGFVRFCGGIAVVCVSGGAGGVRDGTDVVFRVSVGGHVVPVADLFKGHI